ncbi:MAG: hypothetical protein NTX87_20450 [Planctomycetota bacterium]|nr:hypothetical protein [Planctomycetota bacterium]
MVLANLGMAGGIFLLVGWGTIQTVVCASAFGLTTVSVVVMAVTQQPRVVITSEGFAFLGRTHKWEDIDGPLAVIQMGMHKAVAYKLTAEYKARVGTKPPSRFSGHQGYDEVIVGHFRLSTEELAAILNAQKRRSLPRAAGEAAPVAPPEMSARAQPAPAEEAQAQGNGSPVLRVAAGVLAILIAVFLPLGTARGTRGLANLAFMGALALMFGWYAVRGRKGLPRFLTKKLGA